MFRTKEEKILEMRQQAAERNKTLLREKELKEKNDKENEKGL